MASLTLVILATGIQGSLAPQTHAADKLDRTVLPIPEHKLKPITTFDVRKTTPPPRDTRMQGPTGEAEHS